MRVTRVVKAVYRLALVALGAALLAGCNGETGLDTNARAYAPIPEATLESFRAKQTTQNAPVLIRAYKKEAEMEIWKQNSQGRYIYVKTFPMCRWSGQLGPKVREGDRQVPEGFYTISPGSMNPNSAYYLSFNVGYPNAYDRAWGHTGGSIMVHGICSSAGCFSMTDTQIEEIYAIMREAFAGGQHAVQMQSFPFRMTAENMAKHRLDPNIAFWRELKKGADEFEVTHLQTPVGVCNRHYVFSNAKAGDRFDAESACPPLDLDQAVVKAVTEKEAKDDSEVQRLVASGVKPIRIVYQDGGQNPSFAHKFEEVSRPDAIAAPPTEIVLDDSPKAKPVAVQIASARKAIGDGLEAAPAFVPAPAAVASAKPATTPPTVAAVPLAKTARKPVDIAAAPVPATFASAPTAYATAEPKSATRAFFDKVISFGGDDKPATDPVAPAAAPAVQAADPAVSAKTTGRQAALAHRKLRPTGKPETKPEPGDKADPADKTAGLDNGYVALAPNQD